MLAARITKRSKAYLRGGGKIEGLCRAEFPGRVAHLKKGRPRRGTKSSDPGVPPMKEVLSWMENAWGEPDRDEFTPAPKPKGS